MKKISYKKKFTSRRAGQSLMELLIGMAVGAVLIIGSAAIITSSLQENGQVTNIQIQAQLGQELLNNTKAWAQGNWNGLLALATGTSNNYYLNTSSSPFTILSASSSGSGSSTYSYSRSITVSSNASGTSTNFPMLFSGTYSWLEASSSGGRIQNLVTAPNGGQEPADLVFATSSANCGTANLNFETESYTSSTGAINDWVNVSSLSAGTVIYACYDASSVTTDQSHPSSTWNSNYKAVYHFPTPTSTLNINDSTANGNNGTNNSVTATSSGEIDGAGSYNGTSAYIDYGTPASLNMTSTITLSGWVNLSAIGAGDLDIMEKGYDGAAEGYYLRLDSLGSNNYDVQAGSYVGGTDFNVSSYVTLAIGTMYYFVGTYDGTNWNVYQNGNLLGTTAQGTGAVQSTAKFSVGAGFISGSPSRAWPGLIDEARVMHGGMTPSWILTEYNNQSSPFTFYTVGSEVGGGGGSGSAAVESIVNNGVTFQRSFYVSDVYRDSNGYVTSTISGNFYDPSTKLITATIQVASSSIPANTYSMYITRNTADYLDQKTWAGGSGFKTSKTFVSSTYAQATNTAVNAQGGFQISVFPSGSSTYSYSRSITVTSTTSTASGTNANFPMLFSGTYSWLEASSSGGRIQNLVTAPNGIKEPADLVFTTDSACSSNLNFETESYSSSTGAISDWVNVTSLTAGTVIYACYDASSVTTDKSHPSSTWNTNYALVQHNEQDPSGGAPQMFDSTLNSFNGSVGEYTGSWTSSQQILGKIGGALSINTGIGATNSYIQYSTSATLLPSHFTLSAWVNSSSTNGEQIILFHGLGCSVWASYGLSIGGSENNEVGSKFAVWFRTGNSGGNNLASAGSTFSVNTWYNVVGTYDGSTLSLYVNGVLSGTTAASGAPYSDGQYLYTGEDPGCGGRNSFIGTVDEERVASTSLSPSWILTEYNNQNSPSTFYAIGSEASVGGGGGGGSATSTLDSTPFDTGVASGGELNSFMWQGSQPASSTVKFQFAASNSSSGPWTFLGPDGTGNTYFSGSAGSPINLVSTSNGYTLFNGYRYFSYRASLSGTSGSSSAVNEVTVNWSP